MLAARRAAGNQARLENSADWYAIFIQ